MPAARRRGKDGVGAASPGAAQTAEASGATQAAKKPRRSRPRPPPEMAPSEEFRFTLLRCFLTIVIFLALHTAFQR